MTCRVLCFTLSIKEKTLAMFYSGCLYCVYESLVRSRGVCLHIYLGLSRIKIHVESLIIVSIVHKELKETQVGVLMVVVNPKKKKSVDSELSRGRGNKFPTQDNNKMLVV